MIVRCSYNHSSVVPHSMSLVERENVEVLTANDKNSKPHLDMICFKFSEISGKYPMRCYPLSDKPNSILDLISILGRRNSNDRNNYAPCLADADFCLLVFCWCCTLRREPEADGRPSILLRQNRC